MLDGNNNKDVEKIFYFSTLNSQDKLENVNEPDSDLKQRPSNDSKVTPEEDNDKIEESEEEYVKSKHDFHMDDMISYDSSANNQNLINPFQFISSFDKDIKEEREEVISEKDKSIENDHDDKIFKNTALNHIESEIDINFYFNKNDEQDEKNVIIEDVEIDQNIEDENDKAKEEETKSNLSSKAEGQLDDYDEIFPVELIANMDDILSEDEQINQSSDEVSIESAKSNQQIPLVNNSNSNCQELNNVSNNGPETFMKTDDLIDLFSIDPATGRAKITNDENEDDQDIIGNIDDSKNSIKEEHLNEYYNESNPFEEVKQQKAIDDFEFEFEDCGVRREIPIENFNPTSVQIHHPTKEEKHMSKMKNFELERWVDKDISETSSHGGRASVLSSESNAKVMEIISGKTLSKHSNHPKITRHSDGLRSKKLNLNEETSISNPDIEEFISRERSMKEEIKTNSDLLYNEEEYYRKQTSD